MFSKHIQYQNLRIIFLGLNFRDISLQITRTLQIEKVPKHMCKENILKRHFAEAYPNLTVTSVSFAYDVRELMSVSDQLRDVRDAKLYGIKYNEANIGEPLTMKPKCCSRFCSCFCFCVNTVNIGDNST